MSDQRIPSDRIPNMPTNGDAAKRPYCYKHSRAKLDIGGQKICTGCRDEERAKRAAEKA